jgi:hypothetical protein
VPVEKTFSPRAYDDLISSFEAGMSGGVSPLLLPPNQLAFGLNLSVRGGFATHRPPYQKKTFNFNGDANLQTLVQTGLFQGGGYYRPDYGTESLIAQISGHLILFTEIGSVWNVLDISVPGDLNDPNVSQIWMWQAEKWMIVQDGTGKLPIFYDGTISRRSYGPSVNVGTAIAFAPVKPPAIGAIETVTLSQAYTGPYNVPVIFNGEFYQPIQNAGGYQVILTNITAPAGSTIPAGNNVVVVSGAVGITTKAASGIANKPDIYVNDTSVFHNGQSPLYASGLVLNAPPNPGTGFPGYTNYDGSKLPLECGPIDSGAGFIQLVIFGNSANVNNITFTLPAGSILSNTLNGTSFIVGATAADFVVPGAGGSITINLTQPFTGTSGTLVRINGTWFSIQPVAPPPSGTTLMLINLTDTKTLNYTNPSPIVSVPEIPAGRMGAYGMGVNALSLTDGISYVTSDVVGSGAGTQANNYRDAVLKMTQNTFLKGGGSFRLPGTGDQITAIWFPPLLDTSLGQGPLMIGTPFSVFSNFVIGTDPATWANITSPIESEALKDNGPLGQNSTFICDSDTYFRSNIGIGSLIIARRDFFQNSPGNKSVSNEVGTILDPDSQALLSFGSGMSFDNRKVETVSPQTTTAGVIHQGVVVNNSDLLSSLRSTVPSAWEGLWTGLNILQMIVGRVNGVRRAFAFSFNYTTNQIELYESLKEKTTSFADNDVTPILWAFETPVLFNKNVKSLNDLVQLRDGEVYLSDIQGAVHVDVYYRPDFYPCWTKWNSFDVCQSTDANNSKPGYRMRVGLGEPDVTPCEIGNNRPLRNGYFFQCRVVITGSCVFKGMRASCITIPQTVYAPVECTEAPCQLIDCDQPDNFRLYGLQGFPPVVPLPTPGPVQPFSNGTITLSNYCPISMCSLGTGPVATGQLPPYIAVDTANNAVIGAAGLFFGTTQAEADAKALAFYTQVAPTLNIACPGVGASLLANLTWVQTGGGCAINFGGTGAAPTVVQNWHGNFACLVAETAFYTASFCNNSASPVTLQAKIPVIADTGAGVYHGVKFNGAVVYYRQDGAVATPPGYPPGGKLDGVATIVCPPGAVTTLVFQADNVGNGFFGSNAGTLAPATINLTIV